MSPMFSAKGKSIPQWMRPVRADLPLFPEPLSVEPFQLYPDKIKLDRIKVTTAAAFQPEMSRAKWRPAPGRKVAFSVMHGSIMVGLIFLASPVFNLGPRDKHLGLSGLDAYEKGQRLKRVMDMSVCVSAQPIGWHWNLGKLCALLATTAKLEYPEPFEHLTTTSLYGKGSQYNRIFKFLGYTKGFGHEHISDEAYDSMRSCLMHDKPSSRFGAGPNLRMRTINAYRRINVEAPQCFHGNKRGVYISPTRMDRDAVVLEWFNRWGSPRWERTKTLTAPYQSGIANVSEG